MKRAFTTLAAMWIALCVSAFPQTSEPFPATVFTAKTVAIINDTSSGAVAEGATAALRAWGQYKIVEDPDSADLTLRFDKSKGHQGTASSKNDTAGNPTDYSYSVSTSTAIHMKAYVKGAESPFYVTKTDDSKTQAGASCINDFRNMYRVMHH